MYKKIQKIRYFFPFLVLGSCLFNSYYLFIYVFSYVFIYVLRPSHQFFFTCTWNNRNIRAAEKYNILPVFIVYVRNVDFCQMLHS